MSHDYRDRAREHVIEAARNWLSQWEDSNSESVVTGYVLVVESMHPDGHPRLTWMTGNGMPPTKENGGLPPWRVRGMCGEVISDINASDVAYEIKRLNEE